MDKEQFDKYKLQQQLGELTARVTQLEARQQQPQEKVTKFHPGLFILKLKESETMLSAADFDRPTKQVQFTIPEGYVVKEIVLEEKK